MPVKPLSELQVTKRQIPAWHRIPNTSLHSKPLLIYHSAFTFDDGSNGDNNGDTAEETISHHLTTIGAVMPEWTYSMYPTSHYHSTTHEVLCVIDGSAKLCFGHEDNSDAFITVVSKGDVIIVPAGVAHQLLGEVGDGRPFNMVGSYPVGGRAWDMCYGEVGDEQKAENIRQLGWFERDPIYGEVGPVLDM